MHCKLMLPACSVLAYVFLLQTLVIYAEANTPLTCLPSAIPAESRVNVPDVNGNGSVPFGIYVLQWDSAVLVSVVVKILAEELLGYNTVFSGMSSDSSSPLFALAGCHDPNNWITDPKCNHSNLTFVHHATFENWGLSGFVDTSKLEDFADPDHIGDMGYMGVDGLYIFSQEKDKAYHTEGLPLEYYRAWDSRFNTPQTYFDNYTSFDPADLLPCNQTRMMDSSMMAWLLSKTGDFDGMVNNSGVISAKCWNNSWWFAPACRANPTSCVPVITGATGWMLQELVERSNSLHMPLALAVAKDWGTLSRTRDCLPYWWQPDSTFIDLNPTRVIFPPYDNELGRSSAARMTPLMKFVHSLLPLKAPRLVDFLSNVRFTQEAIDGMLLQNKLMGGFSYPMVACGWIHSNVHVWQQWIPPLSKCPAGKGLVDPNGVFQVIRTNVSTCELCPTGKYSDPYRDDIGPTHLCKDCAIGKSTDGIGSTQCASCRPGSYAPEGSIACMACNISTYSEDVESSNCIPCGGGFTTAFPGAKSRTQCLCPAGTFRPRGNTSDDLSCLPCPEGMACELGSDMRFMGQPRGGRTQYPYLLPKYWSSWEEPLDVFECHSAEQCLGGVPGSSCGELLTGRACKECEGLYYWNGDACVECIASSVLFPILPCLLIPAVVIFMYKGAQGSLHSWDTPKNSALVALYILLVHYQTHNLLKGTAKDVPTRVATVMNFFGVANDVFSVFMPNCIGYDSFEAKTISGACIPIGVVIITFLTMGASRLVAALLRKDHLRMTFDGVHHIIGSFMFTFFSGIVRQSLNLFDCSSNPNGLYTMNSDRSIVCYESQTWNSMLALSLIAVVLYCGGSTLAASFAVVMAPYNENFNNPNFQLRWRFLFSKFRSDAYWFGLVSLARGTLINIGLVVVKTDIGKLYWIFGVIMLYTSLLVMHLPFRWTMCNRLDLLCSLSLAYQCMVLAQFTQDGEDIVTPISYVLIAFILLPSVTLLCTFLQILRQKLFQRKDTKAEATELFARLVESASAIAFIPLETGAELIDHLGDWDRLMLHRFSNLIAEEFREAESEQVLAQGMCVKVISSR